MYKIMQQLGIINLASYMFVVISQTRILDSDWDVPINSSLLSSDSAKTDTSGDVAVNLCSSGRRNVCFI